MTWAPNTYPDLFESAIFFLPDASAVHTRGFDRESGYTRNGISHATCGQGTVFEFRKKRLRIQTYPDTCGLSSLGVIVHEMYPE